MGDRGGVLATGAAATHLIAAGYPPDRLRSVGVVGEGLLLPAADTVAWTLLLLSLSLVLGRLLPVTAAERVRALVLRPSPALFALLVFAWVAVAASLVAQCLLGGLPSDVDDIARLFQARTFLAGRLFLEAPPEREAFEVYGLLARGGRWFSKYEPAPALLFALSWKTLGTPTALKPAARGSAGGRALRPGKDGRWGSDGPGGGAAALPLPLRARHERIPDVAPARRPGPAGGLPVDLP